jgi:phthiodiolone/phenolphthiodiolone dimycocerosates ketoreductase
MLAHHMTDDQVHAIIDRVSPEMARHAWFTGNPDQIAGRLQAYIDAGATWISIIDILPMVLDPTDAATALNRSLTVAAALRVKNTVSADRFGIGA